MKCPYPNCRKDYNDEDWPKVMESWLRPSTFNGSLDHRRKHNRLFTITRQCRFCDHYFHEVYVGHENFDKDFDEIEPTQELLISYPVVKTKFESKVVPQKIINSFNEAERCRAVGSLTGVGSCLRKTVYELCDQKKVEGRDYKDKITNLPVEDKYKELLKQIKWLGDNATKPGEEKYDLKMVDAALEILPLLIDEIYHKDEKTDAVTKLLAKAKSANIIDQEKEY